MDYRRSASRRVKWIVLAAVFGTLAFAQMASAAISVFANAASNAVVTGENFDYQIQVFNPGPDTVPAVQVVDTLPAEVTFVSASVIPAGSCAGPVGRVVTCDVGPVEPFFVQTITITVTAPATPGTITNAVTWTPDAPAEPQLSTNEVFTAGPTDLAVEISEPDGVLPGVLTRAAVSVSNLGSNVAQNVVLTIDLPAGATLPFGGACGSTSIHIVCPLGNMPPSVQSGVGIFFQWPDGAPTPPTITASVTPVADDPVPASNSATRILSIGGFSIDDVVVVEGDAGTTDAVFTVTKNGVGAGTVDFATQDWTTVQEFDYVATSGTLTFSETDTTKTIAVPITGDLRNEPEERFRVLLSNPTGLGLLDGTGLGLITDTDPPPSVSINDVTVTEGNAGSTEATFTVDLSAASGQLLVIDYQTADGTATSQSDFAATDGTLTFAENETSKTVTVQVSGDSVVEPDETFTVNLTGQFGETIADGVGVGTIVNDDVNTPVKQPLALTKAADRATSFTGALNGYTITIANPNVEAVTVTRLVDCLPARFTYRTSTTSGAVTTNPVRGKCGPGRSSQALTWTGPIVVPAGGSVTVHFGVRAGSHRGTFTNSVTGLAASGYAVTGTGPTAPIRIIER